MFTEELIDDSHDRIISSSSEGAVRSRLDTQFIAVENPLSFRDLHRELQTLYFLLTDCIRASKFIYSFKIPAILWENCLERFEPSFSSRPGHQARS